MTELLLQYMTWNYPRLKDGYGLVPIKIRIRIRIRIRSKIRIRIGIKNPVLPSLVQLWYHFFTGLWLWFGVHVYALPNRIGWYNFPTKHDKVYGYKHLAKIKVL